LATISKYNYLKVTWSNKLNHFRYRNKMFLIECSYFLFRC